jgi:hypothetical protein
VQLDRTHITVRERAMPEILDLALRVVSAYWRPLLLTWALGVAPMMIVNHLLIGWTIAEVRFDDLVMDPEDLGQIWRYLYDMTALIFLEAPLATVLMTAYLGQAVFLDPPRLRDLLVDVARLMPRMLLCQGVYRGVFAAWLLLGMLDRSGNDLFSFNEGLFLLGLVAFAAILRSVRPFINEIILLERNPLRAASPGAMTIGRRSSLLHNSTVTGDLMLRWMGGALVGIWLVLMIVGAIWAVPGILLEDWSFGAIMVQAVVPTSMWLTAGYFAVVRYLAYLDLRIRQEGWEIELKMRAEAVRLAGKLT